MFGKKKNKEAEKTKLVQANMNRSEVVSYGFNKAAKRSYNRVMIRAVIMLLAVMLTSFFQINWAAMVFGIGLCAYMGYWYLRCLAAGKKLWESIKDKAEPVEIM